MKLARVAVLGVALGAGVVAAVLALNLAPTGAPPETAGAEPPPPPVETTQVLVAAKDISMGTTLAPESFTWQEWPETGLSTQFMRDEAGFDPETEVAGAIARASFYAGEPIVEAKLIHSDRGFMSAILPEGKRAVATRISAETSAGGFILPNDRVDVIMAYANDAAADTRGAATLELTPQQAEIMTVAQQMAQRMTLALRSIEDSMSSPLDSAGDAAHLIGGTRTNGAVTVIKNGVAREISGLR
jgi:pilus assembly protein CpaB